MVPGDERSGGGENIAVGRHDSDVEGELHADESAAGIGIVEPEPGPDETLVGRRRILVVQRRKVVNLTLDVGDGDRLTSERRNRVDLGRREKVRQDDHRGASSKRHSTVHDGAPSTSIAPTMQLEPSQ